MTPRKSLRFKNGERIRPHITVVDALDPGSRDPVHIVWHHHALCPMAAKMFSSGGRARHEAALLDALTHPNIVRCLGLETDRAGPACLLMEYLEGRTLRQLLRLSGSKRMSVSNAMRLAIHIAAALSHMHDRGILHLDIKPSNIIVTHGRPVLFDFGIAREKKHWNSRVFAGSDLYMPPEQCRGEPVSPASDIFSLGLTIYELLTGELPFQPSSPRQRHPQLNVAPRPARSLRPRLPAALDEFLLTCLVLDPRRRPQNAAALVPLLHRFISSGPPMWPSVIAGQHQPLA